MAKGNFRSKFSIRELEELRSLYEGTEVTTEEIGDRFSMSSGALRQFAYRRGWERPAEFYRKGVEPKIIPEPRRETAKLLWDSGESCARVARWIGVSENTAFSLCNKEFGYRNLRVNKQTHFIKRNMEILARYDSGETIEELASRFWLGSKTISTILSKTSKVGMRSLYSKVLSDVVNHTVSNELCKHELVLHSAIVLTAKSQLVGGSYILWPTRGTEPLSSARGISMYLVHVEASYDLTKTGALFGRDRTTVAHACAIVEDRRDDTEFDNSIDQLSIDFRNLACIDTSEKMV